MIETVGSILGVVVTLAGFLFALFKIIKRFENIEESSKLRKEENIVLIKATLAICDGLGQLGANGPVTKCKSDLQEYLIERGE